MEFSSLVLSWEKSGLLQKSFGLWTMVQAPYDVIISIRSGQIINIVLDKVKMWNNTTIFRH